MPKRIDLLTGRPVGAAPAERADAARNRARVLAAAEALYAAAADPRAVTMDDIAKAAGVGRATLYRRYPDPASVAEALLDEHERQLQQRILDGPPPLGPGAPPAERLGAFYTEMVDLLERHLPLTLGAETGLRRYQTGAYGFWRAHVTALLEEAGVGAAPADVLLAPLAPDLYDHLRHQRGQSPSEITASLQFLATRALGAR
ncbi:helix-turn-helix domain-containing protein [Kribbella sp. NPDC048915]|uniref:TetR/AcrR family transcriptional regulator n=1 Tax=Kribbella sp. NPDC048915 TaxID=3155148 RepID=UPI0033C50AB9